MRERDVEKYLCDRVKALGGEVRKLKWIGRNGAPDRVVMLPYNPSRGCRGRTGLPHRPVQSEFSGNYFCSKCGVSITQPYVIWVELKATGKKPEPHQLREHTRMRAMGQTVLVLDSKEAVDEHF